MRASSLEVIDHNIRVGMMDLRHLLDQKTESKRNPFMDSSELGRIVEARETSTSGHESQVRSSAAEDLLMCGIAGFTHRGRPSSHVIRRSTQTLGHRGPDEQSVFES